MSGRVLIVDDEPIVRDVLSRYLTRSGFQVETADDGERALEVHGSTDPDLVLLDIMLPRLDGLAVFARIRERAETPVIMLTARGEETDRVVGLEIGADDYVSKPFGVREVIARIRAVMRRAAPPEKRAAAGPDRYGRLAIDRRAARVHLDGAEVSLTPKEYELLAFLTEEPGALMTREQIMEAVWDANWFGPTKTLDVHVAALRRKLAGAIAIETVRGVGFRLVVQETGSSA